MEDHEYKIAILSAAKEYIARGWVVFPLHSITADGHCTCGTELCGDAGKHPVLQRGLKQASKDPELIEQWFDPSGDPRNIGVVTGEVSGITVLDIDIGPGKFGAESWAEAIEGKGEPQTLMAETGSGGMHVFFKYNSVLKTAGNVLGKGVDSRNDGGYIVAAPSRHRSGGTYKWLEPLLPLASLPAHLAKRKENRGRKRRDNMYHGKYSIEQVTGMLEHIAADDRDMWRHVGIILGREFDRCDEAWALYNAWADKAGGTKGRNHDEIMRQAFYDLSQQGAEKELSIGTIVKAATDGGWAPKVGEVPLGHFVFYGPGNNYIYRPTASYWIAAAVDAAVSPVNENGKIMLASNWLKINQLVTSMTCDPGIDEDYVKGKDCRNGETVDVPGAALFNTYRRPTIELGDSRLAEPFIAHVNRIFNKPGDAEQFLNYMAHRVQKPWEKPRFALLIAGGQGVGKDTAVEMCCPAIGAWNVANIDPSAFETNYNEYAATTLIRINEAANLHEMSKWAFNERTKVLISGNPDTCMINPKYGQKFSVRMYCGVIITTNHLAGGIYIPPDDRRYDVIESATMAEMGLLEKADRKKYFDELWEWFMEGGDRHIAAYLNERDITGFSASSGQRMTDAHKVVVAGGLTADHWLEDILEELGNPQYVRADWLVQKAISKGENENEVKRKLTNTLSRANYTVLKNPATIDGRWKIEGKKIVVYAKADAPRNVDASAFKMTEPF